MDRGLKDKVAVVTLHQDYRALLEDYRHATERLAPILRALSVETGARP